MPSNALRPAKRSVGRPSSYRPDYCELIIEAMAAACRPRRRRPRSAFGADRLFYWQREHPEFLQAIQEGRQKALLWWEERALALAKGEAGNTQIVDSGAKKPEPCSTWLEQ